MNESNRRKPTSTVPTQVRLPLWARDYIAERARLQQMTQKDVLVEAIELLRESEIEALMEEGYREIAESQSDVVEAGLAAALPAMPR
jgi:hypothetical protein